MNILHKKIEQDLNRYTELVAIALCKGQCAIKESNDRHKDSEWEHHKGAFSKILIGSQRIDKDQIDRWVFDTQHGLLHGFLVGFWAFIYKYGSISNQAFESFIDSNSAELKKQPTMRIDAYRFSDDEIMLPSCIFHDFVRCMDSYKDHDNRLKDLFNLFSKDTYTHSNPPNETNLIIGDRIELMRYHDWKEWSKHDISKYYDLEYTSHFYKYIRPALDKIFLYRDDIWARHSQEYKYDLSNLKDFPQKYWNEENLNSYCVEIGRLPLQDCILHSLDEWSPLGLLPMTVAKKSGARFKSMPNRDHLGLDKKIPLEEWIFATTEYPVRIDSDYKVILQQSGGFLNYKLINKIIKTTQLIVDNLICLRSP